MAGRLGTRARPVLTTYRLTPPGFAALRRPIRIGMPPEIVLVEIGGQNGVPPARRQEDVFPLAT